VSVKLPLENLRREAEMRLSKERFAHTLRVEAEAVRLAALHGLSADDTELLRAAALLHDITKELSVEDHLKLCKKWDILLDCESLSCPQILHQFSGAGSAAREFAMPETVCSAIRTHTTGGMEMDTVARILYLADLVEPGRSIASDPYICEVRFLAERDLCKACLVQMRREIRRLRDMGRGVHPLTVAACAAMEEEYNSRA